MYIFNCDILQNSNIKFHDYESFKGEVILFLSYETVRANAVTGYVTVNERREQAERITK